ncbi:Conidiation protein 6-domain-containing protein [Schizothecium vesticola]|uniref:Conidiation protein 6-domain-containing protein n=1 Tax=Schizothecium vesticola TaxID=314040 RepID=A0AA40KAT6_9PEZI|nr:Conidiation protein 6-domain-containing protein [Schizothecium vesticola]
MSTSASTFDSAGAKSVMSNDMKELTEGKEEITNVIRGHKANLSNPNTSEESKRNSEQVLQDLGGSDTQEATRNKPISKDAAEELYGSRAVAG